MCCAILALVRLGRVFILLVFIVALGCAGRDVPDRVTIKETVAYDDSGIYCRDEVSKREVLRPRIARALERIDRTVADAPLLNSLSQAFVCSVPPWLTQRNL